MAFVCTLSSGSSGNSVLVSHGGTHLLIDAGITRRRLTAALGAWGLVIADISAVLVTHEHTDHTSGLPFLSCPVYTGMGTAGYLAFRRPELDVRELCDYSPFEIGHVGVEPFPVPHDAPDTLGFLLYMGSKTACLCTDAGHASPDVLRACAMADYLMLEANHDEDMLRGGRYPAMLKKRIMGPRGHLSNTLSAEIALAAAQSRASRLTLCHLSKDNNTPELAYSAVAAGLSSAGVCPGRDIELDIAPRLEPGLPWGDFS